MHNYVGNKVNMHCKQEDDIPVYNVMSSFYSQLEKEHKTMEVHSQSLSYVIELCITLFTTF